MDGERKGRVAVGKEEKNRNKKENEIIHRDLQNGSVARKESGEAVKGSDGQGKGSTESEKRNVGKGGTESEKRNAGQGRGSIGLENRNAEQRDKGVGWAKAHSGKGEPGIGILQAEAGRENQDAGHQVYVRSESARLRECTGEEYGKQAEHRADIGEQIIQDFVGGGDIGREPERQPEIHREIREQSVSDFRSTTKIMERAGSAVVRAGRSVVSSAGDGEDAALAGAKKIGNTAVSVSGVLAHSGANASYNRMRDHALTVADVADALDRAFAEGCVTMGMLEGDRNAVIQSLHQSGMSVPMAKKTARNLEEIREKLTARAAVLDFGARAGSCLQMILILSGVGPSLIRFHLISIMGGLPEPV